MKIHISLDTPDLEHALALINSTQPYIDAIHIGPLLLYKYGISIIDTFKTAHSDTSILIDTAIVNDGKKLVSLFNAHQPQWITVMAGAGNQTIHATTSSAHTTRIKVMMNLLDSASIGQSAMEAERLDVDALIFHQPYDPEDPLLFMDRWDMVKENTKLPIFIATTVTRENIQEIVSLNPHGIIIGSAAFDTKKPEVEAQFFYEKSNRSE